MARSTASRKWQLTINNPIDNVYPHEEIKSVINEFSSVLYWCMCDEVGENGTSHTHIYIVFENAVMFNTLHLSQGLDSVHIHG